MRKRLARYAYNFTGNIGWLLVEAGNWPWIGRFTGLPYRIGSWFYDRHYEIALRHRFWRINPRFGEPDQPKFIDR
jgi:hypothetical protein